MNCPSCGSPVASSARFFPIAATSFLGDHEEADQRYEAVEQDARRAHGDPQEPGHGLDRTVAKPCAAGQPATTAGPAT